MGILSFIKGQFIEIIEWLDNTNYTLVYRFPDDDHEIKNGAKLVCRENQAAILINEGQLADVFGPGTHTLSTQNLPILSRLKGWKYGFSSPFKVEIYFVNLRQYVDQKWGTANPVLIRDPEFSVGGRPGRVRIRAFGSYNFKISDPGVFFKEIVGTQGLTTTDSIADYLKRQLVSKFTVAAGKSDLSVADMAAHYNVLENAVKGDLAEEFGKLGLLLTSFVIENISLPPEIEKALDAAAAQAARGVDNTMAWEGLNVMRDAARNPGAGGASGAGMGMGMGMGMGQMMAQMMGGMAGAMNPQGQFHQPQQFQQQPPQQQPPADDNSLEAKLRKLKAAFEAELLTEEEYKAKRAKLLEAF
ncbi:SPFH domain-containing protein [Nannocystis pusilla]|uniref:SPFH domain-containing protein n=1 Tax=Nannocystis pusilla TaxID=889268 RepID=A0ABS7TIB1_9BACT|nr:SPFH domain-containing protein [Nannocystis pusilla]MBZ5707955.1 SPFH domain-containing protein [Nannocystis pusilla]